jgi:hypothetical protein
MSDDLPSSRVMRAGDSLVVFRKDGQTLFIERKSYDAGIWNAFASPVLGTKVRFETGSRAGKEAQFCLVWTSLTERRSGFLLEEGVVLFSQLAIGETCKVLIGL